MTAKTQKTLIVVGVIGMVLYGLWYVKNQKEKEAAAAKTA